MRSNQGGLLQVPLQVLGPQNLPEEGLQHHRARGRYSQTPRNNARTVAFTTFCGQPTQGDEDKEEADPDRKTLQDVIERYKPGSMGDVVRKVV